MRPNPSLWVAGVVLAGVILTGTAATAATVSWNVDVSGNWDTAGNWSSGAVPQAGDDVVIDRPSASVTVTHRTGTSSVKSVTCSETLVLSGGTLTVSDSSTVSGALTLSGATLRGGGVITVNGPFTWTGGTMRDTGVINANAGIQLANPGTVQLLDNRTINNAATATWIGAGSVSNVAGATFNNLAGARLEIQTAGDWVGGTFNNAGTISKVAGGGDGVTRVSAALNNTGTVSVTSGRLELDGGGQHSGSFTVEALANLQFGGGTHTFIAGASVSGAGTVDWAGATTNFDAGTYNVAGATVVSGGRHTFGDAATIAAVGTVEVKGGTVTFNSGEFLDTTRYTQSGGTLDGSDVLSVSGPVAWSGGTMTGTGVLNANAGMSIANPGTIQLLGNRTVNNAGEARWTGAGAMSNAAGTTFNNLAGATFAIETAADVSGGTFNNAGTVTKVTGGGDGRTRVTSALNNNGALTVSSGTLELDGGGQHGGTFNVESLATLEFGGGTHTFTPGAAVGSSGTVEWAGGTTNVDAGTYNNVGTTSITGGRHNFRAAATVQAVGVLRLSGGTVDFSSGEALTTSAYTQSGGTLDGADVLTVSGPVAWSGGIMSGTGVLNANAGMEIANPGSIQLQDNRTVNNAAPATWTGAGSFGNAAGTTFNNLAGASFTLQTAADFSGGTFNNAGTLTKQAGGGDGLSQMSAVLNNSGTVDVQSGTLRLTGGYAQTAGVTRLSGGTLESTRPINLEAGRLEGTGTVKGNVVSAAVVTPGLSPGLLNVTGTYTQAAAGVLAVEIGGAAAGTEFDQVAVGGAATLGGTLSVGLVPGFTPTNGSTFKVLTFTSRTGDFATTDGLVIGNGLGFRKLINALDITLQVVEENCADGLDNDGDGRTDCDDQKCADVPACIGRPTATRTSTPTPVPSATPTAPPTRVATATATSAAIATASPTPPVGPTATPTRPSITCVGDCDVSGDVNITELIRGVNIALGEATLDRCPVFDANGSGEVTVNELIVGVNNALNGCPSSGPTPTPTPGAGGDRVPAAASHSAIAVNAMAVLADTVAAMVTGLTTGGGGLLVVDDGGGAGACPLGGTATRNGDLPFFDFTLSACRVPTVDGSATFDGSGTVGLFGFSVRVTTTFRDQSTQVTRVTTADLSGSVSPVLGGACRVTALAMTVSAGTVTSSASGAPAVGLSFDGTSINVTVASFDSACSPTRYAIRLNGPAALLAPDGTPTAVVFEQLRLDVDAQTAPARLTFSGAMQGACFGGSVTFTTEETLTVPRDQTCPSGGVLSAAHAGGTGRIVYRADGSVEVDEDGDGTADLTAPNCLDPRLLACAA